MSDTHPTNAATLSDAPIELKRGGEGRWVTIDGVHVYIENGRITKGPDAMVGKKPGDVGVITAEHGKDKPAAAAGESRTAYHITRPENVDPILSDGFKPSARGELGPGVYVIEDPKVLTDTRFQNGERLTIDMHGQKLLDVPDAANRALATLRAIHGREKGTALYDSRNSEWFKGGAINWDALHAEAKAHGFTGIRLNDTGMAKNVLLFDPPKKSHVTKTKAHAMSRKPYYLSAAEALSDALTPALTLGQGYPTSRKVKVGDAEKEFPVAYFWKDVIPAGEFEDNKTGRRLSVPGKRLDGWVEKFHAMRAAGIEIPAPKDHSAKADDNLGFVLDAKRNGDRLSLLYQVIGEDGALVALRNRASVCIDPDYVDETGKHWGDAIVHSAFTPTPVITGMGEFVPFAASRDRQAETPIYYLSAEQGDPPMDLKALREALGAAADVPDEKLPDLAAQRLTALRTESTTALSRATAAEAKVKDLETVSLSRQPAKPSPTEIYWANKAVTLAREEAINNRGVSPATCDEAERRLVGKTVDRKTITLSRAVEDDDHKLTDGFARLLDFYEIVKDNKPTPPAGSQSGTQLLSREVPGQVVDPKNDPKALAAQAAAEHANAHDYAGPKRPQRAAS